MQRLVSRISCIDKVRANQNIHLEQWSNTDDSDRNKNYLLLQNNKIISTAIIIFIFVIMKRKLQLNFPDNTRTRRVNINENEVDKNFER